MILEQIGLPDVPAQRIDGFVPGYLHQLEHVGARLGAGGKEARAQAMTGERAGIQPNASGIQIHQIGDTVIGQASGAYTAAPGDRPEDRPFGNARRRKPCLDGLDGA